MKRLNSPLVLLLVLLGGVILLTQDCTVLGYGLGYSIDMNSAAILPVEDITTLKKGDHLLVVMKSDTTYDAVLRHMGSEQITIGIRNPDSNSPPPNAWMTVTLNADEIEKIYRKKPGTGGRKALTAFGVVGDLVIIAIVWVVQAGFAINALA